VDSAFLTGLGLSLPAGLNAYLPLLIVALADRFSNLISLGRPYDYLSSNVGIGLLLLLLTVEIVVDKVPGADHVNDLIQSVIRPAAGALLMMAGTEDGALSPALAFVIGLLAAGTVHAAKATTRPLLTVTTGGIANPFISFIEDFAAAASAIIALVAPALVLVVLVLVVGLVIWAYRVVRRSRITPPQPGSALTSLRR
jgi:hypothetical protein